MDKSLNLSSSVLICKDEKASWPPSIELLCTPFTVCESHSRQPPEGMGLWHIKARRWLSGRLAPEAASLTFQLYWRGCWYQRGRWATQDPTTHWQLLRLQNEQKATSSQDCKWWQRTSLIPVPLHLSAERASGTATGMERTPTFLTLNYSLTLYNPGSFQQSYEVCRTYYPSFIWINYISDIWRDMPKISQLGNGRPRERVESSGF